MENNIYLVTIIIGLLLAISVVFFIISILRYHRRYVRLQRDRIYAEITIQENERKRIAADLHDSLAPLLSSVKLQMSSIHAASAEDQRIIATAGAHLDDIISGVREISYNLLPNTLERKGLVEAIREFSSTITRKNDLKIDVYQLHEVHADDNQEIHLFRIIQEIIHNTYKHAEAKSLQIGLGTENEEILILSKDDGKGFEVEDTRRHSGGLGLKSIESRIELLNGSYILKSEPGVGTSFFIKIPV